MSLYVIPITKPRRAWRRRDMERILQQIRQLPVDAGRAITLTIRCSGRGGRVVDGEWKRALDDIREHSASLLPLRRGRPLSYQQLADLLRVNQTSLYRLQSGRVGRRNATAQRIARLVQTGRLRAVRKETLQLLVQVRKDALLPRVRGDIPIRSEVRLQKPRKTG